jgi:ABC-type glycerol-3-phosphate transport system substrate-binding protein
MQRKLKWTVATVGVAVIGTLAAAVALGSPGSGNTITTLVTANFDNPAQVNSDRVKFQTKDATDVRIQKIVFAPGAFSGWHHHPGMVLLSVESGAVTLWQPDCSSQMYGPGLPNGAVFAEGGDVPEQVTSAGGATVYAVFVAPSNDPPITRVEDDAISCP